MEEGGRLWAHFHALLRELAERGVSLGRFAPGPALLAHRAPCRDSGLLGPTLVPAP